MFSQVGLYKVEHTPGWDVASRLEMTSQTLCDLIEGHYVDLSVIHSWE